MYREFFNVKSKPFEITTNPIFLWLGEKHKEALATLRFGILENKGFLLLTGDAGTGKSTLINALTESLDNTVEWAVISDPKRERLDFYNAIAKGFGITKKFTSKVQFLIQFSHFLHKADDENKKVLLLIDDCHRLSQEILEELRLLSNIEKADAKLINIFFVGQREFNEMLVQPNNRAVRQRLALKVDLPALTAVETAEYIRHRLKVAGTEEKLFSAKATQIIHRYSLGIPKRINIICDHSLVAASVKGKRSLDHVIVGECVQKLNLPSQPSQEDFEGLEDEKSHLEHFRGRFTPGSSKAPAIVSGVNLENDSRFRLLKYGLVGGAVLAIATVFFWYPVDKTERMARLDTHKEERSVVMKEIPLVISSPAVAVLEQNQEEINVKKAAELKHTILEKAYSGGENTRQGAAVQSGVEDVVQTDIGQADLRTLQDKSAKVMATSQQVSASTTTAGDVAVGETVVPEKVTKTVAVVAVKDQGKVPELPVKTVLTLAPNSLNLTGEANREYHRFVEKLKLHPKAKLLVKGFVSSNADSPENTKLSENRAMAVQTMLVGSGIEAARVQVKGMGIQEPIASNDTSDGRTKNRRVEIVVVENGK
ncbi:MAG: AAA family ATPase [Proteobacteria bacterium]|nr:AAA family ATPase [Pseudomonadota bacterium]